MYILYTPQLRSCLGGANLSHELYNRESCKIPEGTEQTLSSSKDAPRTPLHTFCHVSVLLTNMRDEKDEWASWGTRGSPLPSFATAIPQALTNNYHQCRSHNISNCHRNSGDAHTRRRVTPICCWTDACQGISRDSCVRTLVV